MKRQANVLSALIQNFDTVENAIEASQNSSHSALRENEKFLDSFEGRLLQLTNTVQTKWSEALDTDLIKDAIDLFTKLVDTLDFKDSAIVDIVDDLVKVLSWLMDLVGDNNFGYTLIAFFGGSLIKKYGLPEFFEKLKKQGTETIDGLTTKIEQFENRRALAQKNLKQQGFTDEQIKDNEKIKQYNQKIEELNQKKAELQNQTDKTSESLKKEGEVTKQVSAATSNQSVTVASNTATTSINSTQQTANASAQLENKGARASNDITIDEQNADIVTQNGLLQENSAQQQANAATTTKGANGIGASLKSLGKSIAIMIIIQAALEAIDGWVSLIKEAFEDTSKTFEELHQEFEKASDDLQQEKSELHDIENELDDIKSQIKDLEAFGTLSFTQEEELNRLKKQREELERTAEIQGIITKNQQTKTNNAALSAARAYMEQSAEIEETREEFIEKEKENTTKWTDTIGNTAIAIGGIIAMAASWTGVGAIVGGVIAGLGAATVGIGQIAAQAAAENAYEAQQTHKQAIDTYAEKKDDYVKRMNEAYAKGDTDKYQEIKEEYDNFEGMMADNIGGLMEYLNSVDYDSLSDTKKKEYEEFQRIVNEYSLANDGSITGVVDSILNYDRYKKIGYDMDKVQKQLKRGEITAEEAKTLIENMITPELKNEFTDLGIKVDDVVKSYVQLGVAAKNNASVMDSLDKISAVTNAFNSLGDAVKEFREEGVVSASVLESLNETFGKLDGFEELYKVLATGEGDLAAAVTNVANAYVGQAGILTDMTDEELGVMVARLKAIGVLNAEEVLMARQTGQEKLDALGLSYAIDLSNYGTAEAAKIAIAQAAGLNIASIQGDTIEELENAYKMDLSAYGSVAEAKIAIAKKVAKEELDAKLAKGEIKQWEYNDAIANLNSFNQYDSVIQGIIDNAYKGFTFDFNNQIGIGNEYDEHWGDDEASKAFQKKMAYWDNRIAANQAKYDQIQNEIDLLEAKGMRAGEEYYRAQIELENERKTLLEEQKAEALAYLATLEKGSEQWWEVAKQLNDIKGELDDVTAKVQELNDAIGQIRWDGFEKLHERFSNLTSDLENIRDILSNEDMFDDEGNWTEAGVATLATYIQDLEIYKNALTDVQKELADFQKGYEGNEDYFATIGIDSESEYYDKLVELTDEQDEYTKKIKDSEQSVVEMYENQIDALEEYIGELIDGYNDYIDTVKEALDAERDLYDFKKNVQKQTKDIASLERRIAALSGSTNAADIAERRKLQAELNEAKEGLNDTYYDHAKDQQSKALDDEAQAYEETMNKYIEGLREMLEEATKDMTTFLSTITNVVTQNAGSVEAAYNSTGLAIDSAIISPWTKAAEAMAGYEDGALARMNDWTKAGENGYFYNFDVNATNQLKSPWSAGTNAANTFASNVKTAMGEVYKSVQSNVDNSLEKWNSLTSEIQDTSTGTNNISKTPATTTTNNKGDQFVKSGKYVSSMFSFTGKGSIGNGTQYTDEKTGKKYYKITSGAYKDYYVSTGSVIFNGKQGAIYDGTYLFTKKYAKGTLGTSRDEWALTDELGDELVLVPGANGNLSFMRKGTSVVPADITANLVEWGKLNPDMLKVGSGVNLNTISNAIIKPELNFGFDSLVHVDNCSQETLKDLEKMVDNKINQFSKQLNYAIKKYK